MKTVSRLNGSYALGVVCADHPGELIAVKSASRAENSVCLILFIPNAP